MNGRVTGSSMGEIEERAEEMLAGVPEWLWDGATLPVPITEIADSHFSLYIREMTPAEMRELPGAPALAAEQELAGLLLPAAGEIWVNADEAAQWPMRRRFTIAHELGHHELHCSDDEKVFCRSSGVTGCDPGAGEQREPDRELGEPSVTARPPLDPAEEEANAFAAALLMPAEHFRRAYAELEGESDRFGLMCRRFGASGRAMRRRMQDLV